MDLEDIQETSIWQLYDKGRNYNRMMGVYADTDRNYRFYNGNQWEGAKLDGVEPVQKNFIKPIVKYKLSVIHDNLYAVVYSSQNYKNKAFRKQAERYCEMLNRYAANVWEQDQMDKKGRAVTRDAAINDEGIMYVSFDTETMMPNNEVIDKNDIYYGNENDDDIQSQPYILIRKRLPVSTAIELALDEGMSKEDVKFILGDGDNFEQAGDASKFEVDDMVTIVYKMYKKKGTVHFACATRWVDICEDIDTGLTLYPVAHFIWEEKKGSARGEGEVRYLIPNQIEVNKTEMRRVLTVKLQAYPQRIINASKISNPDAVSRVGVTIKTNDQTVDDVNKIIGSLAPAQMSPDVKQLQDDLINVTRDLAGAGDTATGQVDPESASGRAILAVQQASQAPMTSQKEGFKAFIEDLARIWLDHLTVYSEGGIDLEEAITDPQTGEETVEIVHVPQSAMEQLKATVKIDITPKSVYDRFAQEQTIENLLMNGFFNPQRLGELKIYHKVLPDDAVSPKVLIGDAIEYMEEQQRNIAMMEAEAQQMMQRAQQFLMGDPDEQASQISDAQLQLMEQEAQMAEKEQGLDEQVPTEEVDESIQ
jgi:hypothetical protein